MLPVPSKPTSLSALKAENSCCVGRFGAISPLQVLQFLFSPSVDLL